MKILHTADLHLREYGDKRWGTLEKLIKIGKEKNVELFVISGDLFDRETDAESLRVKIREIFSNNEFKIILIPGNHDSESYKSGLYFGEDAVILTDLNEPFEYKGIRIWGFPFKRMGEEKIFKELRSLTHNLTLDKKNILLYHGELVDVVFSRKDFGEEGEGRYMPVKLSYFKDLNFSYILAGHFHSKFDTWKLENGGYFVYPGSPISITERETGQRKVNIFQPGEPPTEHLLDTPHFEEVVIELDPFTEKNPIEMIREHLEKIHSEANIILIIKGYINSAKMKINEFELAKQIKEIIRTKFVARRILEFKDIHTILEDDLFKNFSEKLEGRSCSEQKKKKLYELTIRAMIEVRA
ncbi:DNA repair exonuclease [Candidatus Aerophobetes bacterium]|nr:DNA repair exonuclease [Candidatus Aerophobetes bacterium]